MMDNIDYENVTIGKWQSSIPSEICINKEIFNEIFSTETWYKVLMPEQRERILQLLPRDVLETVGAAQQTMEDLLARTLNRFDSNPLDTFYTQLEQGRYDPNVVQTKKALSNAWRKEAVRKRKKYHAKLLQDIVVSREKHLREDFSKLNSTLPSLSTKPSDTRTHVTPQSTKVRNEQGKGPNSFESMVEKRYREEIAAINREAGCISSSDEEAPPKKTAKLTKKITKTKPKPKLPKVAAASASKGNCSIDISKPTTTATTTITAEAPSISLAPPVATASVPIRAATQIKIPPPSPASVATGQVHIRVNREEQAAAQLAKFPKILPAPVTPSVVSLSSPTVTTTITPSPILASLSTPVASVPSHKILTTALKAQPLASTSVTPTTPVMQFQANPVKSSPILASQLQSSTPLPNCTNHNPTIPNLTSTPNSQKLPHKIPIADNMAGGHVKMRNSSEDDELESSSDDEFEAIEPTIGFTTTPTPPVTKVTNQKSTIVKATVSTYTPSRNSSAGSIGPKVEPSKTKIQVATNPKNVITIASSTTVQTPTTLASVKYSNVQLSKILSQPPQSVMTFQQQQQTQSQQQVQQQQMPSIVPQKINVVRLVTQSGGGLKNYPAKALLPTNILAGTAGTLAAIQTSSSAQNLVQTSSSSVSASKTTPVVSPLSKMLPITVNIHQQPNKAPTVRPVMSINTPVTATTIPTRQVTLNGPVNSIISLGNNNNNNTTVSSASSMPNTTVTSTSAGLQMFNLLGQPNVIDTIGSDLNLNLGLAVNNLNDGATVGGDDDVVDLGDAKFAKLPDMEKMDELSVLDGNPFDSIPNLSDELDGLDLDLVDGLCDFEGLLSEEKQYMSFFSLIRDVLCSTRDHRMTLVCLEKTIRKWSMSPTAALNAWFRRVHDWNEALITALNFLAGNYQEAHPEDFVPYIEYKYKTKYYQWIGAGRDSDNNLTSLCNMWLDNVDRLPPLKKLEADNDAEEEEEDENEDSDCGGEEAKKKCKRPLTPPPPRCITDWSVRPSTQTEKESFQVQERQRFDNPHKAFTYQMHGYESVVGPVKGVYSSQSGMTNKARGHSLLVDDRPPYVTILALVRDAVARLPNGEGTRSEICEMLRDSQFLAPEASNVTLNSVVSGALDRLHYERDPCVRYDSHKKSWVYLHRDRTQEQFERLHHNRSYTKSTKSRSNATRKSRKSGKTQSQSNSPAASTSGKDTIVVTTAPTPVTPTVSVTSSAPATPTSIAVTTAKLPPVGTLISKTTLSSASPQLLQFTTTNVRQISAPVVSSENVVLSKTVTTAQKSTIVGASTPTSTAGIRQILGMDGNSHIVTTAGAHQGGSMRKLPLNEVLAAASSLGSTLRFTTMGGSPAIVAVSGPTGSVSLNAGAGQQSPSGIVFRTTGGGNFGSALGGQTLATASGNLVSPQTVQLQVQGVPQQTAKGVPVSVSPVTSVAVSQASGVNSSSINSGQFLLNQQTVIRLANSIRLPEGVRFAQVRLPLQQSNTQPVGSNPVRLPQQRIILTRAALSGQTQAQGVLLTQTPSGQTVILSTTPGALGHLQGTSSSVPISITTSQPSVSLADNTVSLTNPTTSVSVHSMNPAAVTSVNAALQRPATISVMTSQHSGSAGNFGHELAGSQIVVNNPSGMSSGSGGMIPVSQASNILQQMASGAQHIVAQVGGQLQHQSSHGTGNSTTQLASPIIIRSQQGDFVIPGHISLGRGVQGIKVIPVSAGKQTVLARIVAPSQQTASQATASTHQQQQQQQQH